MFYYTYLIQSLKDSKWYTGVTEDLRKRFKDHNSRKVFSTKGRGPFRLIHYEACLDKNDAFAREKFLKSGPGKRYLKNRLKRFRLLTGFTLIESLVVIAIIMVLTVLVLPNYRLGEKILSLQTVSARLNQDFRRVEEWAMSAKTFHSIIPRGGYGIYAETGGSSYILFADCNDPPNFQYDSADTPCDGFSEKLEEVSLGDEIQILSLAPQTPLDVVFTAPHPLVTISGAGNQATIILALRTDSSKTKTIIVNKTGLVETR